MNVAVCKMEKSFGLYFRNVLLGVFNTTTHGLYLLRSVFCKRNIPTPRLNYSKGQIRNPPLGVASVFSETKLFRPD